MNRILALILVVTTLLSLSSCSKNAAEGSGNAVSETIYPITVTDQAGREVVIEKEPERIISSYYISSSVLIALGLEDKMVGIEAKPDSRPIYALSAPALLDLPQVGSGKALDLEACATVSPDLAVLPMKLKDSAEDLTALGVDVLLVNPESQEQLTDMISLLAQVTDTAAHGMELIDYIAEKETALLDLLTGTDKPEVYLAGNSSFLSTAGDAMYQSDMIRLAGGVNAAAAIEDTYWAEIDYEQLLAWDPDYIILPSNAKYTVEEILADPVLAESKAIVNENVYMIPGDAEALDSPVPGSFLGAYWLAHILHPDVLSEEDCIRVMDEYYETFYDFQYSEN